MYHQKIVFRACKLPLLLFLLSLNIAAFAQNDPGNMLISKIADYNTRFPAEKLYLQVDKPNYIINDTIWFKSYIVDHSIAYSSLSSRLYIDILNDSSKVIKSLVVPVIAGISWGNISLNDNQFREGNYTIRAYTNWMRNFGKECFYYRTFHVIDPGKIPWLVKASSVLTTSAGNDHVKLGLKFTTMGNLPLSATDLQFKLVNDKKVLLNAAAKTSVDGTLNLDLPLTDNAPLKNLWVIVQDRLDNKKTVSIPVIVNRAKDIDLQFMPESGYLVAGLPCSVGFKAIGEDGNGVDVKGSVFDENNNEVARFTSAHNGMGRFDIVPQPGDTYTAQISLLNGENKKVPLPAVKPSGVILKVKDLPSNADSLEISILASADVAGGRSNYYVVGQCRNVVYYAGTLTMSGQIKKMHIAKSLFPTGVAHLTLFNSTQAALNERLVFINHTDNLKIDLDAGSKSYAPHDSIPVHVTVRDPSGKPVKGSFSVAVTDNARVKNDDDNGNMITSLLLTSDLKGHVEDPKFYMGDNNRARAALDVLLLTQGWVGYNWKDITGEATKPQYQAETEYTVNGRVTNLLNKPIANSHVVLLSTGKMHLVKDTVTNSDGHFTFKNFPPFDSTAFVLAAKNEKGRTIKAGVSVEAVKPLNEGLNVDFIGRPAPWYVNLDSAQTNNAVKNQAEFDALYDVKSRMLKSVTIKGQGIVKGSNNVNGAGNADQVITQESLEKEGKKSLYELLDQKVKNFHTSITKKNTSEFFIQEKLAKFIIDGVDLDKFYDAPDSPLMNDHYDYLKQYLDFMSAEDITGIEVSYSMRYNIAYDKQYLPDGAPPPTVSNKYAYIEITTRSGNGPYMDRAIGVFVYKPVPLTQPKAFYSPRYVPNASNTPEDLRSTIYWAPFVTTNKDGEAVISFYAADKPSTYTIKIEGSDLKGKIGYQTQSVDVRSDKK